MVSTVAIRSAAVATGSMCEKQLVAKCACTGTPSAVAGIAIPSVAGSTDAKILGFFINNENVLALTTIEAESSYDSPVTYSTADDDKVTGYATKFTSLAAVPLGGLTAVYGVVTGANDASGMISLLSPVAMPLGVVCDTSIGSIAASSDPKHDVARIYYRKPACDDSAWPVHEFTIAGDSVPRNLRDVYDGSDIANTSYLAAFYDSKNQERHIMYQNYPDGYICDVNLETQTRMDLKEANPNMTSAGLTSIYIPDNHKTYCYYVCWTSNTYTTDSNVKTQGQNSGSAKNYQLYKAKCDWNEQDKKWEWSAGRNVTPITVVHEKTQLSVTSMVEAKENYIVYTDPSGVITCKHDAW